MRKILFTWNYPHEFAGKLRYLCMRQNISWREVLPVEDALPLKSLKADAPSVMEATDEHSFSVAVFLFAGFNMRDMDAFTTVYGDSALPPVPLKAMITPTNRNWNIAQLVDEISKEHEAMTGESIKG